MSNGNGVTATLSNAADTVVETAKSVAKRARQGGVGREEDGDPRRPRPRRRP